MPKKYLLILAGLLGLILIYSRVPARTGNSGPRAICDAQKLSLNLYELKSRFLILQVGVQEQRLIHCAINNRLIPHVNYLEGEEFIIQLEGKRIRASDFLVEKIQELPDRLVFSLKLPHRPVSASLEYKLAPSGLAVEKTLTLKTGPEKKLLSKVCMIENYVGREGTFTTFPGPGQPAYKGNLFFAVAYPMAEVKASGLYVSICYNPGVWVGEEGYTTYPGVIGVSEPGKTAQWFFKYLDAKRHRPAEPYLLYNTWYDMPGTVNTEGVLRSVSGLKQNLTDPYGIKLDAVVLDDGWDDPQKLWQFDREKFPDGIAPVLRAAQEIGAAPGMWFSPAGGYPTRKYARMFGTLGQGYEKNYLAANMIYAGFCPAGQKYHQAFKQRIVDQTKAGVAYYKLDNIGATCVIPWHHHPTGKYSKTAITDALIDTMNTAHALNPDAYFNITVGTWLSPFWLLYADCVWMGGMDYGFSGPGSLREKNITYKDQNLYDIYRVRDTQFPINGIMTHGVIKGHSQFKETGPLPEFERDVVMYLGRGVSMWELYLSPEILTQPEWAALAKWIQWAKDNWPILQNTQMVLGNPHKLEIYGYLHQKDNQAILVLRNPSNQSQTLKLKPEVLGLQSMSALSQEYPGVANFIIHNSEFIIPMNPFEVKILRFN